MLCINTPRQSRTVLQVFFQSMVAIVLSVAAIAGGSARAQLAGTGAISGTVLDPTGAVVGNATVVATNIATNVKTTRTTTNAGDFNITPLIPGQYTVTVTAAGFQGYKQENVTVDALSTVSVNVKLTIGQASETVTITSAPPLLSTTDATLGGVMDNEMYSSLPLLMGQGGNNDQRRATDFEYLMPGVQANYTSNNSTDNSGIVNGSGPAGGVSDIYIEGVDLPEADQVGDPRFTWTAISVDAINQFQVQTAGVSSQYAGQGVENYSVKSGSNQIHGSIYEYLRNTVLDAWQFNAKVPTINSAGVSVPGGIKPKEIQNEFGIVLSGPVIKDKLFVFANYGQYRNQNGAKYAPFTIPTAAELGLTPSGQSLGYADFTGYALANGNTKTCTSTTSEGVAANGCYDIYDPASEAVLCNPCTRSSIFANPGGAITGLKNGVPTPDVIPGSRISQTAAYINKYWIPYEQLANQNSYTNNLNYGTSTGLANWYMTSRLDYDMSPSNQIALIVAFGRQASTGPNSTSGLGPPFNTSQAYHPDTTIDILKDTYTINAHLVNQAAFGFGRYASVSVTPDDASQYNAASLGLLGTSPGQATNGFPEIQWSGGAQAPPTLAGYAWNSKVNNTYTVTDNLQWNFGKHNLTFGGQYVDAEFNYYKSLGPTGPMDYTFSSNQTAGFSSGTTLLTGTGSPIASYDLGAVSTVSVLDLNIPGLGTRWRDPSFWAQDDYKVSEKLTLNLGLRWDIFPSITEAHNLFTFFNPNGVNSITGNLGTLEFAGSGNPQQYCNCSSPSPTFYGNIGPRLGMAYAADSKTVIRGSYTVNFARGDWTSGSQSGSPSTTGLTPSGALPSSDGATTAYPVIYWDGTACANGTSQGVNCGFNGLVNPPQVPAGGTSLAEYGTGEFSGGSPTSMTYFDKYKGARTPEFINWTFGIQRQITRDMSLTLSYVGSQGHFIMESNTGADPVNDHNGLTEKYAALAGYNTNGTTATPCSGFACTTPLLTAKATAGNIAAASGLGFAPPNPYTSGVAYLATNGVYQYEFAYPQYSGLSDTTDFDGNTAFHAFEASLRQRAAHGLDFMLNYTYSKTIDDVGTFRVFDNPRLDRSLSVTDEPQNLAATAVYQSPFGKGKMGNDNFIVRALASDWNLSGIFTYHSGLPTPLTATGCPGDSILSQCMPNVVPGQTIRTAAYNKPAGGQVAATGYTNSYTTIQHFNPAAFTVNDATNGTPTNSQQIAVGLGAASFIPGDAPRVAPVFGQSFYDLDIGLKRLFPIYERFKLQVEADMSNVTNHVVFNTPTGSVGTSSYGLLTSSTPIVSSPRDVQLAARLIF
jgi:hypothetical protein